MTRRKSQPFSQSDALALQLLDWAADGPRTYREAMETWGTHCPVFPIWEDAIDARWIEVLAAPGLRLAERPVRLTAAGRGRLDAAR